MVATKNEKMQRGTLPPDFFGGMEVKLALMLRR
jgi:hypothetical protein